VSEAAHLFNDAMGREGKRRIAESHKGRDPRLSQLSGTVCLGCPIYAKTRFPVQCERRLKMAEQRANYSNSNWFCGFQASKNIKSTNAWSAKFMGEFRFGKFPQVMI